VNGGGWCEGETTICCVNGRLVVLREVYPTYVSPNEQTIGSSERHTEPPSQLAFKRYFPPGPFSNLPLLNAFCSAWLADGRKFVCNGYLAAIHANRSLGGAPSGSGCSIRALTIISS
jgi:hypothetical protein